MSSILIVIHLKVMGTPGVAQGSEITFCFLNRNHISVKNETSGKKTKKPPKAEIHTICKLIFDDAGSK
jgi:hypothetical protein